MNNIEILLKNKYWTAGLFEKQPNSIKILFLLNKADIPTRKINDDEMIDLLNLQDKTEKIVDLAFNNSPIKPRISFKWYSEEKSGGPDLFALEIESDDKISEEILKKILDEASKIII